MSSPLCALLAVGFTLVAVGFTWRRYRRARLLAGQRQGLILAAPKDLLLTDIEVGPRLGGGTFGEVFKGTWQGTTPVALKRLQLRGGADQSQRRAFFAEARTLLSLNHPYIVRFLGLYSPTAAARSSSSQPISLEDDKTDNASSASSSFLDSEPDIVMEYVSLGSVDRLVRQTQRFDC